MLYTHTLTHPPICSACFHTMPSVKSLGHAVQSLFASSTFCNLLFSQIHPLIKCVYFYYLNIVSIPGIFQKSGILWLTIWFDSGKHNKKCSAKKFFFVIFHIPISWRDRVTIMISSNVIKDLLIPVGTVTSAQHLCVLLKAPVKLYWWK